MRLTVAICTWNRWELLRGALEQMTLLRIPGGVEWELLIVNNGCTDSTDAVIGEFSARLPIRRLHEPNPGLSNARNCAVAASQGDYLLWTDDDALVDKNWIAAYVDAFRRWPEAAFFGGPIRPLFAVGPPRWLERAWPRVGNAYASCDLGDQPRPLDGFRNLPNGANYVVRMKEQRAVRYDPWLGHRREVRNGGEEVKLMRDLISQGCQGWWVPDAAVHYYAEAERMTVRYIRSYYVGIGRSLARTKPRPRVISAVKLLKAVFRFACLRYASPAETWMRHLVRASTAWGRLTG